MRMRTISICLLTLFFVGTAEASQAKVQTKQSNWTKIKELFK